MTVTDSSIGRRGDQLGEAVVRTLRRRFEERFSYSVARAVVVGFVTLGIGPWLGMARRLRHYTMFQRQQMWHLSEWLRLVSGSEDARALRDWCEKMRFREGLQREAILCAAAAAIFFLWSVNGRVTLRRWWRR